MKRIRRAGRSVPISLSPWSSACSSATLRGALPGQGRARVNVVALDDPCCVFGLYNGRSPGLERLLAIEARRTHLQGSPNFEGCNGGSNRGRRGRASPWWCVTPPMSM